MRNPGRLNKKIEIWGNVKEINELHQTAEKPKKIKQVWAGIIPQAGRLINQPADTLLSNITHKIIIRYSAYPELAPEMWIMYKNKRFDIEYIIDPYESNDILEIYSRQAVIE